MEDEEHHKIDGRDNKSATTLSGSGSIAPKVDQRFAHIPEWIGDEEKTVCPTEFSCFIPYNLVSQHSIPGIV